MQYVHAARRSAVEKLLLDYHRSPGKYAHARRQSSPLHSALHEVLQLAGGRPFDGDSQHAPSAPVRQAACFFIRSALLFPDADHYALLGLERSADPDAVKDRYRQMMRLMHPDFAATLGGAAWPSDAATRVNQAYEVLSSPVLRRAYDDELEPTAPARPLPARAGAGSGRAVRVARPAMPQGDRRLWLRSLAITFGAAGALALLATWLGAYHSDKESLVQRQVHPSASVAEIGWPRPAAFDAVLAPAPVPTAMAVATGQTVQAQRDAFVNVGQALGRSAAPASSPLQASPPSPAPLVARQPPGPPPLATAATPAAQAPAPPQYAAAAAAVAAGPTLAEVHPLLSRLLQEIESGWGDRVLGLLDRDARGAPAAQELLLHYNALVDGMRPVKLSNVQFRSEPHDGRLLVTGHVLMQLRNQSIPPRELAVQAEFAARDGSVVMTRLVRAQD